MSETSRVLVQAYCQRRGDWAAMHLLNCDTCKKPYSGNAAIAAAALRGIEGRYQSWLRSITVENSKIADGLFC